MADQTSSRNLRRAVFFDRDGTLTIDQGYLKEEDKQVLQPMAKDAIGLLRQETNYLICLISNQQAVAKGLLSQISLEYQHAWLETFLFEDGDGFDYFHYCTHLAEDDCNCRKPKPGALLEAAKHLRIDLANSWMIGDKASDLEAALGAGCHAVYVCSTNDLPSFRADYNRPAENYHSVYEAVLEIVRRFREDSL